MKVAEIPDLTLPLMPVGTHGTPWDLRMLLFQGGAATRRRNVADKIRQGELGELLPERMPLVVAIHRVAEARLIQGNSTRTIHTALYSLTRFVAWVENTGKSLALDTVRVQFIAWVDYLVWRESVQQNLTIESAYKSAITVASLIAEVLRYRGAGPARFLMNQTRMGYRRRMNRKAPAATAGDEKKLSDTFTYGHLITDLCCALTTEAIRGPLPINVVMRDGQTLQIRGQLVVPNKDLALVKKPSHLKQLKQRRAALAADVSALDARPSLVNLRIESEMKLFISQTGMNLTQATQLRRAQYRWQSVEDELQAFRVYKGRRQGEAIFRCFKTYREHLERYMTWLKEIGLSESDDRMFPFLYHRGQIPAEGHYPTCQATAKLCKEIGIRPVPASVLRKIRINWLLRRTGDLDLAATLAAHRNKTLVRSYEEPDVQTASIEVLKFHRQIDDSCSPPGPGACASGVWRPGLEKGAPPEAPLPDCISPDGCLFCIHHRDVMSMDYCLKLASHSRLKSLEAALIKPSKVTGELPSYAVIDRIETKLRAMAAGSEVRALWVREARDSVRSGVYHALWAAQIELLEVLGDAD